MHARACAHTHTHTHTVPKGTDGGTLNSSNGLRAMEYICQMEKLTVTSRPFSWVLIRPPWSSAVSNKVCVYHKMVEKCLGEEEEVRAVDSREGGRKGGREREGGREGGGREGRLGGRAGMRRYMPCVPLCTLLSACTENRRGRGEGGGRGGGVPEPKVLHLQT